MSEMKDSIIAIAQKLGFSSIGFSAYEKLHEEVKSLEKWLLEGRQGEMSYLENHLEIRKDPSILLPEVKSIISLAYNYYTDNQLESFPGLKISKYSFGQDYHKVIRKKLKLMCKMMEAELGIKIKTRICVDSAPIMEREWAKKSGLGWFGKNTLIIHPKLGSYFFLAEILCDLEVKYDEPIKDHCGTCTKCIDACPTNAIDSNGYNMDASKCISYLTIEYKQEEIPDSFKGKMENWIFGCDICQDVCPWNKFKSNHNEINFLPTTFLQHRSTVDLENLTKEEFDQFFEKSALKRSGYKNIKRNIQFLK